MQVRMGLMAYWSLGQETDPDRLNHKLAALGYDGYQCDQRSHSASLKAALGKLVDIKGTMVRPLKRKDSDGYIVVKEDRGHADNEYDTLVHAKVDKDGNASMERGWGVVDEYALREATRHFRRVLPAASVSKALVSILENRLSAVSLRPNGGLYFIPAEYRDAAEALFSAVEACASDGTQNDTTLVPFEFGAATLRDVAKAITEEVAMECNQIKEDLGTMSRTDAVSARAIRALGLMDKTRRYEELLGTPLEACREALAEARRAFTAQKAVEESVSGGAFAGVF